MIYLLRSNASNALAIGGKKGASAATAGGAGVANHLVAVTRARSAAGNRRRTISNIFDHYGGGSRSSDGGINSSTSSSSTTLHQTSYNHNHHHHSERQGQLNRTPLIHKGGYICFRLARKSDVPQIQNCNLATLPENYNSNFYINHMRKWPNLALVAEHIPGYILGKVEERPIGHVTSIAVHSHARRLGIASSLLNQLHYHLGQCHNAKSVGLHVRISNGAAVKLYCERLGYDVADIIPFYYGDGEDAYFMRKDFDESNTAAVDVVENGRGRGSRSAVVRGDDDGNRQYYERRDDWVNRDARNGGSFFDNRRSMRDTLSPEERAWINSGGSSVSSSRATAAAGRSTIGGHFKRSFQTFLNGGDPSPTSPLPPGNSRSWDKPVWETGPEYLRLPRYAKIQTGQRIEEDAPVEYEQRIAS
ncbi:hypothetical protein ACHAWC_004027 [Mediolabrus comicus]